MKILIISFLNFWIPLSCVAFLCNIKINKLHRPLLNRNMVSETVVKSENFVKFSSFLPKEHIYIEEDKAIEAFSQLQIADINVPSPISDKPIPSTFLKFCKINYDNDIPIVMLHGFDSSCLEYRRLAPIISSHYETYVPDILGWGFIDHNNVKSYDPDSKIEFLKCFIEQVVKRRCILVGASLGGGIGILLATKYPDLVSKLVLIDAQGFIDGSGPSNIPNFLARFGVQVLKSEPLRMYANKISYSNPKRFATSDAMRIGRLHCFTSSWEDASVSFLKSGGFIVSNSVPLISQETLIIWGRNDNILEPSTALKFQQVIQNNKLQWIEDCGHVPHLEKPFETSQFILDFLSNILPVR